MVKNKRFDQGPGRGSAKPKGKKAKAEPQTADEFEAEADEHERFARKHRANNVLDKAYRFFGRAIETYDAGLKKFPNNADMAYNRARVQLEFATSQLGLDQVTVVKLLEACVEAHRYALRLDPGNTDTLFNASQALSALAEEIANTDGEGEANDEAKALGLLEEAYEMLRRCLEAQAKAYALQSNPSNAVEQTQAPYQLDTEMTEGDGPVESATPSTSGGQQHEWATVVDPITLDVLVDTVEAQLGILTTMCDIVSNTVVSQGDAPNHTLSKIEKEAADLLQNAVPDIIRQGAGDNKAKIDLAREIFACTFLEASFRSGSISAAAYSEQLDKAYEEVIVNNETALISKAKSLLSMNLAMADAAPPSSEIASIRWNGLQKVIPQLENAWNLLQGKDDPKNLAKAETLTLRGDACLHLHALRFPPWSYEPAIHAANQLLSDGASYYRGASKMGLVGYEARSALLLDLQSAQALPPGEKYEMVNLMRVSQVSAQSVVSDMAEQGYFPADIFEFRPNGRVWVGIY